MVEFILSLFIWVFQIGMIVLIAAIVPFILFIIFEKKKQAIALFAALFLVECIMIGTIANNPIFVCPEEYKKYITVEKREDIVSLNDGIYSMNIPVFRVLISVQDADENNIVIKTTYLFFGYTEMSITEDGPSIITPLS